MTFSEPAGMLIERISESVDLDAVAALEADTFTNPWTREMLERELRQSDVARVYVVRLPGYRVAAFCACWLVYDELHINTIAVDTRLRRQGLATALMTHLLAEGAAAGRAPDVSRGPPVESAGAVPLRTPGIHRLSRPPQLLQPARRGRAGVGARDAEWWRLNAPVPCATLPL